MSDAPDTDKSPPMEQRAAKPARRPSLWSEFYAYLMENKKWWMIPIVLLVLLLGIAMIFLSTPAAPMIYTLF